MDDLKRVLKDLQEDDNLREWILKSANEASADVVLADLGYNVTVAELRSILISQQKNSVAVWEWPG